MSNLKVEATFHPITADHLTHTFGALDPDCEARAHHSVGDGPATVIVWLHPCHRIWGPKASCTSCLDWFLALDVATCPRCDTRMPTAAWITRVEPIRADTGT